MKLRWWLLIWGIPLILVVAYLLRDIVRLIIIVPLFYLARVFEIIYNALPQSLWWGAFLFGFAVLAIRSLSERQKLSSRRIKPKHKQLSQARKWTGWVADASADNAYARWILSRRIAELTLLVIAHQERKPQKQIRQNFQDGKLDLPPEIYAYLMIGIGVPSFNHYSDRLSYLRTRRRIAALDLDPEEVINYLENCLRAENC